MNTLEMAQQFLEEAELAYEVSESKSTLQDIRYRELSKLKYMWATAYAAVAQAEQSKRIADMLEKKLS